jgi:hypothetical protein
MRQPGKFSAWYFKFLVGVIAAAGLVVFVLGHMVAAVRLNLLLTPWMAYSGLGAACGPLMYFSLRYNAQSKGDTRYVFATIGLVGTVGSCLLFHYASQFGLISHADLHGLCITAIVAIPLLILLTYYLEGKRSPIR